MKYGPGGVMKAFSLFRACGEVVNASVRKTDIHQFNSDRALNRLNLLTECEAKVAIFRENNLLAVSI